MSQYNAVRNDASTTEINRSEPTTKNLKGNNNTKAAEASKY